MQLSKKDHELKSARIIRFARGRGEKAGLGGGRRGKVGEAVIVKVTTRSQLVAKIKD